MNHAAPALSRLHTALRRRVTPVSAMCVNSGTEIEWVTTRVLARLHAREARQLIGREGGQASPARLLRPAAAAHTHGAQCHDDCCPTLPPAPQPLPFSIPELPTLWPTAFQGPLRQHLQHGCEGGTAAELVRPLGRGWLVAAAPVLARSRQRGGRTAARRNLMEVRGKFLDRKGGGGGGSGVHQLAEAGAHFAAFDLGATLHAGPARVCPAPQPPHLGSRSLQPLVALRPAVLVRRRERPCRGTGRSQRCSLRAAWVTCL